MAALEILSDLFVNDMITPTAPLSSAQACGKRCVLSLRPERCGNKSEHEKPDEAGESGRGASTANAVLDEHGKTGEEKKRARSGVVRTRAMATSDTRPSTAPAGRSGVDPLSPGISGTSCSLITSHVSSGSGPARCVRRVRSGVIL